jgi:radical SAM protein with 4Fe4S-binding SPASM domain
MFCIPPSIRIADGFRSCVIYDSAAKRAYEVNKELGGVIARTARFSSFGRLRTICRKSLHHTRFSEPQLARIVDEIRENGIYVPEAQLASCPKFEFDIVPPQKPRRSKIEVTGDCNLACRYCYARSGTKTGQMPKQKVFSLIEELYSLGVDLVEFMGGEPLLSPHIRDYIDAALARSMKVRLATNATLLNDRLIEFLVSRHVQIQISLHGIPQECSSGTGSDRIQDPTVAENIRKIASLNPELLLLTHTVSKETVNAMASLRSYAANLHVKMMFGRPFKVGAATGNWGSLRISDRDLSGRCLDEDASDERMSFRCAPCNGDSLCILHDGSVSTCVLLRSGTAVIGNVYASSLSTIWKSDRREYLSSIRVDAIPICSSCEYRYLCGGGCMAGSYSLVGRADRPFPYCAPQKKEVRKYYREEYGIKRV